MHWQLKPGCLDAWIHFPMTADFSFTHNIIHVISLLYYFLIHTNGHPEMQAGLHKSRQNVHVESVGVSTATSCDASTQTPVDAENSD